MSAGSSAVGQLVARLGRRLRFPQLFLVTAALFVLDLLIPDLVPLADELLLGLLTLLLASWRRPRLPETGSAGEAGPRR
jgi:hypothetical protein